MHGVRTRTSCAAIAATQAQAAVLRSLTGSTAGGLLANLVVLSHLRAIPNSDGNSLREFRTLAEVKFRFLAFGSSMVWVGPSTTRNVYTCPASPKTSERPKKVQNRVTCQIRGRVKEAEGGGGAARALDPLAAARPQIAGRRPIAIIFG